MNLKEAKKNLYTGDVVALKAQLDAETSPEDRNNGIGNLCMIAFAFFGHINHRAIKFLFNFDGKDVAEYLGKECCKELFNLACKFSGVKDADVTDALVLASYI